MPKKSKLRDSSLWTPSERAAIALCAGCDERTVRRYLDAGKARAPNDWRIRGIMMGERYRAVLMKAQEVLIDVAAEHRAKSQGRGTA